MAKAILNGQEIFGNVHIGQGGGVEPYIASTGSQYIDLPFYSDEDIQVEFDLMQGTNLETNRVILGDVFQTYGIVLYAYGASNQMRMTSSIDQSYSAPKWVWSHIELDFSTGTLIVDGTTIVSSYQSHGHNQQHLFGLTGGGGNPASCAIKNFKVYKDGDLFLDFEPRKDETTGEGYFHDKVSRTDYYGNNSLIYGG